jgi:hypothetical protein
LLDLAERCDSDGSGENGKSETGGSHDGMTERRTAVRVNALAAPELDMSMPASARLALGHDCAKDEFGRDSLAQ